MRCDRSGIAPTSYSLLFACRQAGSLGLVHDEPVEEVCRMARPRWQRLTITIVKSAVTIVVLWAVGRHVLRTWSDLRDHSLAFKFEPGWLDRFGTAVSGGPVGLRSVLRARGSSQSDAGAVLPDFASLSGESLREVRSRKGHGSRRADRHDGSLWWRASTAAIATFYETLVMMASGGLIAAVGFAIAPGTHRVGLTLPLWGHVELPLYVFAAVSGLAIGWTFLILVVPSVFGRLAGLVSMPIPGMEPEAMPRITGPLLGEGLLWSSGGWVLLGMSQLAVVRAFDPARMGLSAAVSLAPAVIASVALATVAGFVVAVLPGGLGVREGVLMSALAPAIGSDHAVIASLVLRLVWVAAEVVAAAILVPWIRTPPSAITAVPQSGADYS